MGRPPTGVQHARSESRRTSIVEFVAMWHEINGYGPSLREVADGIGLGLSSTAYHVRVLVSAGRLDKVRLRPRSLRVVEHGPTRVGATTPRTNGTAPIVGAAPVDPNLSNGRPGMQMLDEYPAG